MTFSAAALAQLSGGNWQFSPGTALLAVGGLLLYVASRAAGDALAGTDPNRAALRAVGHCLPIAAVALLCLNPNMARPDIDETTIGRPQVAVGLLFGSSVALLTLTLGVSSYLAPIAELPATRRAWPFVLPASLIALVAGFAGHFTWLHAGAFVVLGGAVANLWAGTKSAPDESPAQPAPVHVMSGSRWAQLVLAVALTGVGAWAMARGVSQLERTHRVLGGALLASAVLSPLLTLPVLGSTARLAERGHTGSVVSTLVAMVLVNLCVVLPLVIVAHHALVFIDGLRADPTTTAPATQAAAAVLNPAVPMPIVSWRVDTVVLAVMGFAMIPWAAGRWTMSRVESIALIFAYAIYLALVTFILTRWR